AGRPEAGRFTDEECRAIANTAGIAAVQYADLSQNRSSNYVFSWDKMLALDGNTAPYLLYAVARIHSILRKAGVEPPASAAAGEPASGIAPAPRPFSPSAFPEATAPETPAEITLARKLVKFADAARLATDTLRPHFLCLYLYELAGDYSAFNNADKVLVDDAPVRARRLLLCARTLLVLETGLNLLGLRTLERM
ncbi:MAG: arginine--tRNA ligase, partial [Opitutaceae bacterium]|nr:arginine--tRNA ligase [Opitutaceae bacterium]